MNSVVSPICRILYERPYPHPDDANLSLVLAELTTATFRPFVVWTYNRATQGYGHGDYYATRLDAEIAFTQRWQNLVNARRPAASPFNKPDASQGKEETPC
ncbi:MAG: hypothetical protein C7B43_19430 [Sulfobacillus benefaciens]|uniref:Uncharacterized protein n=1 Tax=Sulfobacillus benefaciens TaxID=453960 RepID=A0A2T2WPZ2_9FIRM|nr:MAG: hypothetical protein C7B43_19430 [Sulfobacillus benefaciens]